VDLEFYFALVVFFEVVILAGAGVLFAVSMRMKQLSFEKS